MKKRKQFISWLFEISQSVYIRYFKKNQPWHITKLDLLQYPSASFGRYLGDFLEMNGFDLIPKVERHDAYHVLTNYNTIVENEIAQQYLCFGNGKRSLYLFMVIIIGTVLLPDYLHFYIKSYKIGRQANIFHNLDFKNLLETPFQDVQSFIFSKRLIKNLKELHYV